MPPSATATLALTTQTVTSTSTPSRYGGAIVPSQGNLHINAGQAHVTYSTDPPTSGPHFPVVPQRGIYTTPFATEYLPHFLEHGGVNVNYNQTASPALVQTLTMIVKGGLVQNSGNDIGQVTLSPRPGMPCTVAVAAWGRLETWGTSPACLAQVGDVGHEFDPNNVADVAALTLFISDSQCRYDPENQCGFGRVGEAIFPTVVAGEPTVVATLGSATAVPGQSVPQAPSR